MQNSPDGPLEIEVGEGAFEGSVRVLDATEDHVGHITWPRCEMRVHAR